MKTLTIEEFCKKANKEILLSSKIGNVTPEKLEKLGFLKKKYQPADILKLNYIIKNKMKTLETSDFLTSIILMYFKHDLIRVEGEEKKVFTFEKKENTDKVIKDLLNGKLEVEPLKMYEIRKRLNKLIYN